MTFYLVWMALGYISVCALNVLLMPLTTLSALYTLIAVTVNYALIFGVDCLAALAVHKLPRKWFSPYCRRFKIAGFEKRALEAVGIRRWKDKIPELGQLCNFKKNKLAGTEETYLFKFLEETCYAEGVHFAMAALGFAVLFLNPIGTWLYYPLQLCIFNVLLNVPPILVQRYNRPKLLRLYERRKARCARLNETAAQAAAAGDGTTAA